MTRRGSDSDGKRIYTFQANSEELCLEWMKILCRTIGTLDLLSEQLEVPIIDNQVIITTTTTNNNNTINNNSQQQQQQQQNQIKGGDQDKTIKTMTITTYFSKRNFDAVKARDKSRLQANMFMSSNNQANINQLKKAAGWDKYFLLLLYIYICHKFIYITVYINHFLIIM